MPGKTRCHFKQILKEIFIQRKKDLKLLCLGGRAPAPSGITRSLREFNPDLLNPQSQPPLVKELIGPE
jgi:hypothetical protein